MKVYIGPYVYRWISRVHDRHMHKKYGFDWPDEQLWDYEDFVAQAVEDTLQWIYNHTVNLILDRHTDQKIKVRIDKYDTWSMDHTLAPIILPMLKQLKETKHGSPWTDDEDVPEELRSTSAPPKKDEYDIDDNHFKRWDWALDEMIWAFEQKCRDHWEEDYYGPWIKSEGESLGGHFEWVDDEGRKAHQERITNGFRLFGKYYEALWD